MAGGRPSKFDDVDKEYWAFLLEKGYTNREIAMKLGVDESTIYNWMKHHVEFFKSLKGFREFADSEVEASLYQRAKGYKVKEVKTFYDSKIGSVVEHEVTKHYPPDATSMIFWLKNRKPESWRDKQEIDASDEAKELINLAYKKN